MGTCRQLEVFADKWEGLWMTERKPPQTGERKETDYIFDTNCVSKGDCKEVFIED